MVTSLVFVEKHFGGVRLTVKPLKPRLSRKEKARNTIAAYIAETWLSEPRNRLIILSLLSQLAQYGTAIGMSTGEDVLSQVPNSKFYANPVIKRKRAGKTN